MKTNTKDYVKSQTSHECKVLPCDIPPFCRNNFFTGKLLTERDLTAEQRYLTDKLRLHHTALHGWGIVCGLKVKAHPHCPQPRVIVEPGIAVDQCGRFIRVLKEVEVELPPPIPLPSATEDPCPPESETYYPQGQGGSSSDGPQGQSGGYGTAQPYGPSSGQTNYGSQQKPEGSYGKGQNTYPDPTQQSGYGGEASDEDDTYGTEPGQPTGDLYICLSYAECEAELMPAPFDECACSGNGQKPNRICETYHLTAKLEAPEGLDDLRRCRELDECDECSDYYKKILDDCTEPVAMDCLPLAVVEGHRLGDPVTDDDIDNWSVRPILPSSHLLDQLVRCILKKAPTKTLTKIVDVGWTHRGEYSGHEFMREFIGDAQSPRGFEVTFGGPVRREGLTPRTFQAVAVRYADRHSGGQVEVVPARVRLSNDRRKAYLEIDRTYAERRLAGARFDLFLRLRCGHIVDDMGMAIDGDLIARIDEDGNYIDATPTGDGIAGGLFESWIKVMPGQMQPPTGGSTAY